MSDFLTKPCTAFTGQRLLFSGPLADVAIAIARSAGMTDTVLVFDDATGSVIDLDLRGGAGATEDGQRGRGRPKLGVVAREVTLLPRQWEWLASQSGGASATLRRLVDDARKAVHPRQQRRAAQEAAYHFMQAIAGDLPAYEEATRSLFADDRATLEEWISPWPEDIRAYAMHLAFRSPTRPDQDRTTREKRQ